MINRKERPKARTTVNKLLKEKKCTILDLHYHSLKNRLMYTPGLKTQINKMFLEHEAEVFKKNLTYIIVENRKLPVVYCVADGKRWFFYCPFCQKRHYHGAIEGHRHAHCGFEGDSIFRKSGYYLKLGAKK